MIPKTIHYCWFGNNELSELAKSCIASWEEYCPDYKIVLWNESNFDVNSHTYVREAYKEGKYAFVTDYVRLYVLYHYGGIYMDSDVEILKPLDKFLTSKAFTGCENTEMCVTGLMAAEAKHSWIEELLSYYDNRSFYLEDGTIDVKTNTKVITEITMKNYGWERKDTIQNLREDLKIYPSDYFCAKNWRTGEINKTPNTYAIHHFSGSWHTKSDKIKSKILKFLGPKTVQILVKIKKKKY